MTVLTRTQVLAYRWAVHQGDEVLQTGVQDNPPGRTAAVALRARGADPDRSDIALLHSVRGATHVHRRGDLGLFAAALRIDAPGDLAPAQFGTFPADLAAHGLMFGDALDEVAQAMRAVMADGQKRTKGQLSTALIDLVDARLRPWCDGCAAFHVQDALFRWATLQAGLMLVDVQPGSHRYDARLQMELPDPEAARREIVRRFLHLHGPARPAHLATWLALTPAGARRFWRAVEADLVAVTVDGRRFQALADDLEALRSASRPTGDQLFPPYDPLTELGDRELLVPLAAQRRKVWRPATNPGVLLADGEIAGIWRQRRTTVTVEAFRPLSQDEVRTAATRLLGPVDLQMA